MRRAATVDGDERLRLFVALELPDVVVETLRAWSEAHVASGRRAHTFHVTLAFLGARPAHELHAILGAVRESALETSPFELELVRYRETRSVGMLVLADRSGEATRLAERVQTRLEELAVYRPEARRWLPHITVVRFRERPNLAPPLPEIGSFAPSGAAAFLSRLRRSGAHYEVIESYPLSTSFGRPDSRPVEAFESGG